MKKPFVLLPFLYIGIFVIFTAIFIALFQTSLFSSQHVLFYRGLVLLVVTLLVTAVVILVAGRTFVERYSQSLIAALVISLSLNLTFFVVFPVTFERSVTMYLLYSLDNGRDGVCGGLTKEVLQDKLINEYVVSRDAVAKRMDEQTIIHMVEAKNDCYKVTNQAKEFLHLSQIIKSMYNIK